MQTTAEAKIASGQNTSDGSDITGSVVGGVGFPAAMDNTAITFQVATRAVSSAADLDASDWRPLVDAAGNPVSVTVTPGAVAAVDWTQFFFARFVRITGVANESADRVVDLFVQAM